MLGLLVSSLLLHQVWSAPQLIIGGGGGGAVAGAAGAAMMAAGTGMMVMNPTMALFPIMLAGASFVKVSAELKVFYDQNIIIFLLLPGIYDRASRQTSASTI